MKACCYISVDISGEICKVDLEIVDADDHLLIPVYDLNSSFPLAIGKALL